MTRDSFVFYRSFYEGLKELDDADRLACYDAIAKYGLDGISEATGVPAAVLALVRPILDANNRKVEAGRKGGEVKQSQADGKQSEAKSKQSEAKTKQRQAKGKLNEKCEMLNEKEKEKEEKERSASFVRPTLEEVSQYCQERENNVSAQAFIDFYTSKGWKVGNQPMKDWKAAIRTWERRETARSGTTRKSFENQRNYDFKDLEQRLLARG